MKKILFFLPLLLTFLSGLAQPPITRSSNANTVYDVRLGAQKNFLPPTYADTTEANLSANIGLDSIGALIFTYDVQGYWHRVDNPKRWERVGLTSVVTQNSSTLIFSGDGSPPSPLTASVIISGQIDNIAQVAPDGVYVKNPLQNGRQTGGEIVWVSGYTYDVAPATYVIGGIPYASPDTRITLVAADATFNRIDRVVVNTNNQVAVITGTPAADPQEPSYDPVTQLPLAFILVQAGTTEPTPPPTSDYIYLNNNEWTTLSSTPRINPASTLNPWSPTLVIEGTAARNNDNISFTDPTQPTDMGDFDVLTFKMRSKVSWGNQNRIVFRFYNDGVAVGNPVYVGNGSFGFNSTNLTGYQTIVISKQLFGALADVDYLLMTVVTTTNTTIGFYIDDIQLQDANIPLGGQSWELGGNVVGQTQTIGTIDNFPFPIVTNNITRGQFAATGQFELRAGLWLNAVPRISFLSGIFDNTDYTIQRASTTDMRVNTAGTFSVYNTGVSQLHLKATGQLQLNNYGDNTFVGTPTRWAAFDVDGNVIEVAPPIASITADGGLSTSSSTNVRLGGSALVANTSILTSTFSLTINSSNTTGTLDINNSSSGRGINVVNSSTGQAIVASSAASSAITGTAGGGLYSVGALHTANGYGLYGVGTTNYGVRGESPGGGVSGSSSSGYGGLFFSQTTTDNLVKDVLYIRADVTGGDPVAGFGGGIFFELDKPGATVAYAGRISSYFVDVAQRTTKMSFATKWASGGSTPLETLILNGDANGAIQGTGYGGGLITGTAVYSLGVDANGNFIEMALGGAGFTNPMSAIGSIITSSDGAGTPVEITPGAAGTVLTSNGAGAQPTYQALSGTGTVISVDVSGSDFTFTGNPITTSGTIGITLATVNGNVGSFGSSTAIPSFTVNAKGLITAVSTNSVIAPAGTLTGTTLASNVVTSSLTSVGTIGTGVWQGTPIATTFGGAPSGGTTGQILRKNSNTNYDYSWVTSSGTGTMTSLTLNQPVAGLAISGSGTPITTSSVVNFTLANDIAALEGLTGTGIPRRTGTDTWVMGTQINLSTEVTNVLGAANGGTGISSYTPGRIIVSNTSTTLSQTLPSGSNGIIVTMSPGAMNISYSFNPAWQTLTEAGSTITWNVASGGNAQVTLNGTGRSLVIPAPVDGHTYTIRIIQGSGGLKTITSWPAGTKWPNGIAPDLSDGAAQYDIVSLKYQSSTGFFYGAYGNNFQ